MEFDMQAVAWLVLLVVMLAAEAVTLGLTTIWFAVGALAAFDMTSEACVTKLMWRSEEHTSELQSH